jgi:hypothetical protein
MIDRGGKLAQRRQAVFAEHPALPRVDQNDAAAIAELAQVGENLARPSRPLGRADDGQRGRLQHACRRSRRALAHCHAASL